MLKLRYINQCLLCFVCSIIGSVLFSQGMYINNSAFYTSNGMEVTINGNIEIDNTATIENNGDISLTENWINDAGNTGLINNRTGHVNFNGTNQFFLGSSPTTFSNLNLLGGSSKKEAFQDFIITDTLNLEDAELQVHQNLVHLTNTDPNSLLWFNGFISGDSIGGYFLRSTASTQQYRFPVGNSGLSGSNYRAIDITPINSNLNTYGVRLAFEDASNEITETSFTGATGPYSRAIKDLGLLTLNENFYHQIIRPLGNTAANIGLYFFEADQPTPNEKLDGLAQWELSLNKWGFTPSTYSNISGPIEYGSPDRVHTWLERSFKNENNILAVTEGDLAFVPQIFSPNDDGLNDLLFVRGRKINELKCFIYNRWGEKVYEITDKSQGWDGSFRGKDAQSGVYIYYLEAEIEDYGPYKAKGNITLVR